MENNMWLRTKFLSISIILLLLTHTIKAQQWLGPNNSDSLLTRSGGLTIGANPPSINSNGVYIAKHFQVRSFENGDLSDFVNQHSNLGHDADVIWAVLCGPQPNNPGLFHVTSQDGAYGASTQHERFIVRYDGNVGIGLKDPLYKLDVNGTIHTREIIVDISNWPDYIFKKEYELMPLKRLDEFIKKNNHLPGIPSSTEVKENGIRMGDVTNKLLGKIEELTLYAIKQDKEFDTQKNTIEDLQEKNKALTIELNKLENKINKLTK